MYMMDYIKTQEPANKFNETPFLVNNEPVMKTALEVLSMLEYTDEITLARSITNRIPFETSIKN